MCYSAVLELRTVNRYKTCSMSKFVHLRVHTEFSLVDSTIRIKPLLAKAAELGMPAVAITDVCNFYGLIKFYAAAHDSGVKPIAGADFWIEHSEKEAKPALITLLAMNHCGYKNIIKLISRSYQQGQNHGIPYLHRQWISEHTDGVIALSGGCLGDVGRELLNGRIQDAKQLLSQWQQDFPQRFYLELQRTGRDYEEAYIRAAVNLANEQQVPVVATNDVRFLTGDEFEAHEVRVCIGEGRTLEDPRRENRFSSQQYLRSSDEMAELFSDIPQALANSVEIAKRCNLEIELGKYYLPDYSIPDDFADDPFFADHVSYEELESSAVSAMGSQWSERRHDPDYQRALRTNVFFQKVAYQGLYWRFESILDRQSSNYEARKQSYLERLRYELKIIMQMGFCSYFLIVMDFIRWAKDNRIPVGPGRGSGAGSLVAYAQQITDLDPLAYDLLFERFLNPERVSMPDFDVDFCMDKRDLVIDYVADRYGRDSVSQIITFGTLAAKAVVRDVARVQGKSYGLADKLSKMIPFDVGMTLEKAYKKESVLQDFLANDSDAQEIWDMAVQLEGISRNAGKHAGGVVIAPTKLVDFTPLSCDENGTGLVTQYDKDDVESVGLIKFDFLGLRTLTIIDWALEMINRRRRHQHQSELDINTIPLDDPATYSMLKSAKTTAVFQLESRGMKDLIKRLQPDNIEDMIALVALFRPGPLQSGMVDDFINRKHGRATIAYPDPKYQHDKLKPILEPTYGVIVYQEQVMQIAQELAGYTLGSADLLRRAMGKKKPEEMAKQRSVFESGAKAQGIDPTLAIKIFDLVEKFAGYGFNKSHSAAYALLSYQTAWLKTNFPAQFMAATLSSDMDKTDKVVTLIEECRVMKVTLLPPDVNQGEFQFTVNRDDHIIYGLGAIKGLGKGPVDAIIAARATSPFTDLFDFCVRVDLRKINKRVLEALVRSGALDTIGPQLDGGDLNLTRAILLAAMDQAIRSAEQNQANVSAGMVDLFGGLLPSIKNENSYQDFLSTQPWTAKKRLDAEKETLGLYLTGHPIDEYEQEIHHLVSNRIVNLKADNQTGRRGTDKKLSKVMGLVVAMRVMKTKRGDNMAFVTLDDRTARIEVTIFSDTLNKCRDILIKDALLMVEGQVIHDDFSGDLKMRAESLSNLEEALQHQLRSITVVWSCDRLPVGTDSRLAQLLNIHSHKPEGEQDKCLIYIDYIHTDARVTLKLGPSWQVQPTADLIQQLKEMFGQKNIRLAYNKTQIAG